MNATETADAQAILARMAQPLDAGDRELCAKMGIPEADYKAERDRALGAKLPGHLTGLSREEIDVAAKLGITPEAYAEAKKAAG